MLMVESGRTTELGRPWSAQAWHRSELRKRRELQKRRVEPTPPPQRRALDAQTARRRKMFDGDLRVPLPARFVSKPPPWTPRQKQSSKDKQLHDIRAMLGPALKSAMATMPLSGKNHLQRVRSFCHVMDRNGDGLISAAELCDSLMLLGSRMPLTKKQVDSIFTRLDHTEPFALTFDEFATLFAEDDAAVNEIEQQDVQAVGDAEMHTPREAAAAAESDLEADPESSFICTRASHRWPLSPREVKWSAPASSLSARRAFLKRGSHAGPQPRQRTDMAPTLDANVAVFAGAKPTGKSFEHRDVTPEKWIGKEWNKTPGTLERLIAPRAVSLAVPDTTSPAALAAAAATAAEAARVGTECRSKFKFTPRHCKGPRPDPVPQGRYQELWHRALPLEHPEHMVPNFSPKHPFDWRRPAEMR